MDAPCRCFSASRAAAVQRLSIAEEPTARPSPGSVAAHTSPAALCTTGRAPTAGCTWVGRRQPRADGVHNDRCRGQFCGERARQSTQSSFADSIPRCRAASECAGEDRIGVGAGAATDVDDPGVCTSLQSRQKRLNHSPAAEQVDLHNAPPSQQYCPSPVITPVVRGLLRCKPCGPAGALGGPWDVFPS
jgi:hypothetical protein